MAEENQNTYRNEIKYIIDKKQALELKLRLQTLCSSEKQSFNKYLVRTLYFDDIYNSCFFANREGLAHRQKIRIRTYNYDYDNIFIELKKKDFNLSSKNRCLISKEICKKIISNSFSLKEMKDENEFLFFVCTKIKNHSFLPKIIVEYDRAAFSFPAFNTRITIDSNIKSTIKTDLFFEQIPQMQNVINTDKCILEVKYSQLLPRFMYNIMNIGNLKRINFSKYYFSRKSII